MDGLSGGGWIEDRGRDKGLDIDGGIKRGGLEGQMGRGRG